jgi:hypothetical protein
MKILVLLLLTVTPLLGRDFITFKSDEGAECTYSKFQLNIMSGVVAIMSPKGEYVHTPYIRIYVKDLDKMFPKLVKMNEEVFYMIYVEKQTKKYKALKGVGPFSQKTSTSSGPKSALADIEIGNCQVVLDRLLALKLIAKPAEKTDKETKK